MADVVPFKLKDEPSSESQAILATLENVMDFQERLEKGMKLATQVIVELQSRIRDLEHNVTELKKPKKPVILNSTGVRAN